MKQGDIILTRFPQTDLQQGKLRPALIVAVTKGSYSDLLLALISSRLYQAIDQFDEIIYLTDSDYSETGLKVASVIRLGRLVTVESSVINARLGSISPERLTQIKGRLVDWLRE